MKNHDPSINMSMQTRKKEICEFYKTSIQDVDHISSFPHKSEDRNRLLRKHNINLDIFRAMVDYDRCSEASIINEHIKESVKILDFGCLVSDYGIYFAELGHDITICDKVKEFIDFSNFRFKLREKTCNSVLIDNYEMCKSLFKGFDLIIFGEVLEHLNNPIQLINYSIENEVKYIFTSRYPFGDERYYSLIGHKQLAKEQQKDCIKMLAQNNYICCRFLKDLNLWKKAR